MKLKSRLKNVNCFTQSILNKKQADYHITVNVKRIIMSFQTAFKRVQ